MGDKDNINSEIGVISPDLGSGTAFTESLRNQGLPAKTVYRKISPRVVSDNFGRNRINPSTAEVSSDIARAISQAVSEGFHHLSLACNTASLDLFLESGLKELKKQGLEQGKDFRLLTTIDAIRQKYSREGIRPPLVIGTQVIAENLPKSDFDTTESIGRSDISAITQEVIWREKEMENSDTSTAPSYNKPLNDPNAFQDRMGDLIKSLEEMKVEEVLLMCTELGPAFARYQKLTGGVKIPFKLTDASNIVAEEFKRDLELVDTHTSVK